MEQLDFADCILELARTVGYVKSGFRTRKNLDICFEIS